MAEQIGIIGVDAGLVWIGDPCYCVTPDATEHPAPTWHEFCELLDHSTDAQQFNYHKGHPGLGVCVGGFGGDGSYPVFCERDATGQIVAVTVRFDCPPHPKVK